jgi:hypothetical protein
MNVVIAYTPLKLRPEVRALGESVGAVFEDVSGSDMAYGELVGGKLWKKGETFLLIEHDIVAPPALLEEMARCDREWCSAFAWRYTSPLHPGESRPQFPTREKEFALFCNKFSASLLARTPHVIGGVRVRWTGVDLALLPMLKGSGATPCQHGPVTHLHQQHPDWAATMTEADWGRVDA